jgi:type IV pilus assembly protein PilB
MFDSRSQAVFEILREGGRTGRSRWDGVEGAAATTGHLQTDAPGDDGAIGPDTLRQTLAECCGCEFLSDLPDTLSGSAVAELPPPLARRYGVVPLRAQDGRIDLLAANPFDHESLDDLAFVLGCEIRMVAADADAVHGLIQRHYGAEDGGRNETPVGPSGPAPLDSAGELSADDLAAMAGQASVVRLVDSILEQAVRRKASDIHIEPFEEELKVRYRIDGTLHELPPPPRKLALPVISRLKVIANLDIAERRLPQDGRIRLQLADRPVDLRVSTLPTQFGESVVLRILDQSAGRLSIAQLNLPAGVEREFREIIQRADGLVLVTGPTGSGKTTTLYGALGEINRPELKLLTVEDPVEYEVEGIMQVPINPAAGLTFASALRSFLRQDPDVVMVGEIRDLETARIALQASLTGHLVFSTLHTGDSAGAITRLIDLGVEPYLIASSLQAVLAQRLLRRVCPHCAAPDAPAPETLKEAGVEPPEAGGPRFVRGAGCAQCNQSGYLGRLGIFEWLRITDRMREFVGQRASVQQIRAEAVERQGMRSLRSEGMRLAGDGFTTIDEVLRYT